MPGSVESQVAVNTDNIARLEAEVKELRRRCHELENDRATVGLLQRAVNELTEQLPNLARQAARDAVTEYLRRQHADKLSNWRTYASVAGVAATLGGLVVAIITLALR